MCCQSGLAIADVCLFHICQNGADQIQMTFMNSWNQCHEMCPLVVAKADSIACKDYMVV